MPRAIVLKMGDMDEESARRFGSLIQEELGDRPMPEGQLLYVAGPSADGWCMVEVWESTEALARWQSGGLMKAAQRAVERPQAPEVTAFEVKTFRASSGSGGDTTFS